MMRPTVLIIGNPDAMMLAHAMAELRLQKEDILIVSPDDPEAETKIKEAGFASLPEVKVPVFHQLEAPVVKPLMDIDPHPHIPKHLKYGYRQKQRHRK